MFKLKGGVGFCNAVRRTLLSDVTFEAPCTVEFQTNESCQTDEFLAHRIGLIPFRRCGNGSTMTVRARGPTTVLARDVVGEAFDAVYPDIEIIQLARGQSLDCEITFDVQPAHKHARYCKVAAVGMKQLDDTKCQITFETIDQSDPREVMEKALDALDGRIDRALLALADHKTHKSFV